MPEPTDSPTTEETKSPEPKASFFNKKAMAIVVAAAAVWGSEELGVTDLTPIGRDVPASSPEGEEEVVPKTPLEVKETLGRSIEVLQDGCAWNLKNDFERTADGYYVQGPDLNFVIAKDNKGALDEVRIGVGEPMKELQVTFLSQEGVVLVWNPKKDVLKPVVDAPVQPAVSSGAEPTGDSEVSESEVEPVVDAPVQPVVSSGGEPTGDTEVSQSEVEPVIAKAEKFEEVPFIPAGVSLAYDSKRFSDGVPLQLDSSFRAIVEYETASGEAGRAALQYGDDRGMQNLKRYALRGLKGPSDDGSPQRAAGPDGAIHCTISDSGELTGMEFIGIDPMISEVSIIVSGDTHRGFEDFGAQSQELHNLASLSLSGGSPSDRSIHFDIRSICEGKRIYRETNAIILLEVNYKEGEPQLFTLKPFEQE